MSPGTRRRKGASGGHDRAAAIADLANRVETARRLDEGAGEAVLRSIVEATVALFDAEAASIALYDVARDRLVFRVAAGEQGQGVIGLEVPPAQGLVGYVYSTGQAIALSDVEGDKRFGRAFAQSTGYVPRSIVAVPLGDGDGTIGVLEVLDKRGGPFSLRDIELASVFARQAAVAISASRVERDTRALVGAALGAAAESGGTRMSDTLARVSAELDASDETGLWRLVEQVARIRRASPEQIELLADLLAVLADHGERAARRREGTRAGRRAGAPKPAA
jgi:GAF domain-containing protein